MEEVWKAIPGYEGYYEASSLGNIRGVDRVVNCIWGKCYPIKSKLKATYTDKDGYLHVCLSKEHKTCVPSIHRLVAMAFIENPENKPCIDHIDGDKKNNRVENLRWCTVKENNNNPITIQRHKEIVFTEERNRKVSLGLMGHPVSDEARRKMAEYRRSTARKVRQYTFDGEMVAEWENSHDAAKELGVKHNTLVGMIYRGKRTKGSYTNFIFKYVNK